MGQGPPNNDDDNGEEEGEGKTQRVTKELPRLHIVPVYTALKKKKKKRKSTVFCGSRILKWAENASRTQEIPWDAARSIRIWLPISTRTHAEQFAG